MVLSCHCVWGWACYTNELAANSLWSVIRCDGQSFWTPACEVLVLCAHCMLVSQTTTALALLSLQTAAHGVALDECTTARGSPRGSQIEPQQSFVKSWIYLVKWRHSSVHMLNCCMQLAGNLKSPLAYLDMWGLVCVPLLICITNRIFNWLYVPVSERLNSTLCSMPKLDLSWETLCRRPGTASHILSAGQFTYMFQGEPVLGQATSGISALLSCSHF